MSNWSSYSQVKRGIAIVFFLFSLIYSSKATHIVGGELYYVDLGNNDYEIRLTIYRDCLNGMIPYDSLAAIRFFNEDNVVLDTLFIPFTQSDTLPNTLADPCIIPFVSVCYEVTTYVDTINLPPITGGYQMAYQRCCRNVTILNIIQPLNTGATFFATIPDTGVARNNSNPVFNNLPPSFICSELPFVFDHSATDADGDSLVYELTEPLSTESTALIPTDHPPFPLVSWDTNFSVSDMLGGAIPLSIDRFSGELTATPGMQGQYVVGIQVLEYRDGVLIGRSRRDYQFNVEPCTKYTNAALVAPDYSCETFSAVFTNQSFGDIDRFLWNFGDTTTLADTSEFSVPIYTYPDTGVYEVSLIAYSSFDPKCNDTAYATVSIVPDFNQEVIIDYESCTQTVNFEVSTSLDSLTTVNYQWDFGDGTGMSEEKSLSYTYVDSGTYSVSIFSSSPFNLGCSDTSVIEVIVLPTFEFQASFLENPCSPIVDFQSSTTFDGLFEVNYFWDFGVNSSTSDTSNESSPSFEYLLPGNYFPTITASVDSPACAQSEQFELIIYPELNAEFLIDNKSCSYGVEFSASTALDQLVNTSYQWDFGDGNRSTNAVDTHNYAAQGTYEVKVMVTTENGCADSLTSLIEKDELADIFIPTAFTPNNDGENDVLRVRGGREIEFQVFNRWGEKVFETNDPSIGWNGYHKGKLADPGVFVYSLKSKCLDEEEFVLKGNVTLIR